MVIFIMLSCLLLAGVVSGFTPVTYPARVSSECGQYDPLQDERLIEAHRQVQQQLGPPGCNPPKNRTCQGILRCFPSALSGYYQISAPNGSLVQVYCDMECTNCGGKGGWTRIAYVNMSQSGSTCPQGLTQRTLSGLTFCGRNITTIGGGCQSTMIPTLGLNYSKVCGRLKGYNWGLPNAFLQHQLPIDDPYVDGVSITYYKNTYREHIWTYANGHTLNRWLQSTCPCNTNSSLAVPPYVGNDYYCEAADNITLAQRYNLYSNDTLWDGQQCSDVEAPCCTHPDMPWFNKALSETTTEDIELRVCGAVEIVYQDTLLQEIEIFIH